jgi:phosphoribosylanthranilate isomerase
VRVKICGITRDADLRAAVAAGADALGFVFARRSKRCLEPLLAEDLVRRTPAFISRVGLFMDQDFEDVARILDRVPLSLLQFHGNEDAAFCRQFGMPYLKAVSMQSENSIAQAEQDFPDAAGLLLDSHCSGGTGGTGKSFDWSLIRQSRGTLGFSMPLVLAGGLAPENVRSAVEQVKPWAVDVSSGVEDEPGVKNEEKMKNFIREAKREY